VFGGAGEAQQKWNKPGGNSRAHTRPPHTHAHTHTHIHTYTHTHTHRHTHRHTHTQKHAQTHAQTHAHTDTRTDTRRTDARTHRHTHTHICIYVRMYIYIYARGVVDVEADTVVLAAGKGGSVDAHCSAPKIICHDQQDIGLGCSLGCARAG